MRWFVFVVCVSLVPSFVSADDYFKQGDRVLIIGNTLVEREQKWAGWEIPITLANAEKSLIVRNLGWSGDTVWAESRGMFDPPAVGYKRMLELVNELKPTVIILGYGGVEAFDGTSRIPAFITQYQKLMDDLKPTGARFVLLSPIQMELESFPEQSAKAKQHVESYNENVIAFRDAIAKLAESTSAKFVDLTEVTPTRPATVNGLHLTQRAYFEYGNHIAASLSDHVTPTNATALTEQQLQLQTAIVDKNQLFFHRWRPQNFTYLFGFRKHEQGQNSVEIAQFDPFVAELEKTIFELAKEIAKQN